MMPKPIGTHPLRRARKARKMTLQHLAEMTSTNTGNLSRIERFELMPSPKLAERIAGVFAGEIEITEMHLLYPHRYAVA